MQLRHRRRPHDRPDPLPARLAALKTTPTPELKIQWRELFDSEPPPFNRSYLESRLAYRVRELTYGGLKPDTVKWLEALGEQARIAALLVERIDIGTEGLNVKFRMDGLTGLAREMRTDL